MRELPGTTSGPAEVSKRQSGPRPGQGAHPPFLSSLALTPWPIGLFLLMLLLPNEAGFRVGELQLFPYRLFLLISIVPCCLRLVSRRAGKVQAADILLVGFSIWMFVALAYHYGPERALESSGILVVESFGGYLLARCFIRDARSFRGFFASLTVVVIALAVFTIPESLTGKHILRDTGRMLFGGGGLGARMDPRFGLERSFGPFEHPILYGVFCASALGSSFYIFSYGDRLSSGRLVRSVLVIVSTFMSVSSGAMAAVTSQMIPMVWDRVTRRMNYRWSILAAMLGGTYVFLEMVSNRGAMKVALSYLTFSEATAYNRMIIWEYGTAEVRRHPVFGIGFEEWERPVWMFSSSMDNFWLVNAVQFGLPAALGLVGAVSFLMFKAGSIKTSDERLGRYRKGWLTTMVGLCVAGGTVHFWGTLYAFFFLILGSGAWLLNPREDR